MQQCAACAERDERVLRTHGQQCVTGLAGLLIGVNGKAREGCGFRLVGDDVVAQRVDVGRHGCGGGGVEDGDGARGPRDLQALARCVDGLFQLGDEDLRTLDGATRGFDIL